MFTTGHQQLEKSRRLMKHQPDFPPTARHGDFRTASVLVFVMVTHPVLRTIGILIASLGSQVQKIIGRVQQVNAARVGGVGVENIAALVLVKCARSRHFIHLHLPDAVIVGQCAAFDLLRRE